MTKSSPACILRSSISDPLICRRVERADCGGKPYIEILLDTGVNPSTSSTTMSSTSAGTATANPSILRPSSNAEQN